MSNLGRDKVWTPEVWTAIDNAVMAEVGRLRVGQKVFPAVQTPNAANVSADVLVAQAQGGQGQAVALMIQEGATQPFMEISAEFALTQSQVENESTLHTAETLARMAARTIAGTEDLLFFRGAQAPLPPGVRVTNPNSAGPGLLARPGVVAIQVPQQQAGGYGENTFAAVGQAIGLLTANGHAGPYALLLEPTVFADAHAPAANSLTTTADRIVPLVEGRFYSSASLPPLRGLVTSLGGSPTTIYVAQDAVTAYTQEDQQGNYRFRVFERVQIVPREDLAFIRLEFAAQAAGGNPPARGHHL